MKRALLFSSIFCILLSECYSQSTIQTSAGSINGSQMTSESGREFLAFRGVPYAKPPVGQLRFQDPEPADPWSDVLDATREGPSCVQYNFFLGFVIGDEDCLKLNVYTHDVKPEQLKPVMVWIHGGSFVWGSGNGELGFYGPNYFLDRDIVLVTINYRLGPFGFLSTEDDEAPGNYGLLDQTMALGWIREHIGSFGGDPDSITIFGESAGGTSVEFHILSPLSKGLFHRGISQSGSSLSPWSLFDTMGEYTKILGEHFNCSQSSSREMVDCLREIDPKELVRTQSTAKSFPALVRFGPRIDVERKNPFLPAHPLDLFANQDFNHVPYITGVNQNEGCLVVALLLAEEGKVMKEIQKNPIEYIRYSLGMEFSDDGLQVAEKILQRFDEEKPLDQQLDKLSKVFSDVMFFKPIDQSANFLAKLSDNFTYFYHYAHRGEESAATLFGAPADVDLGVCHADELFVMFSSFFTPPLTMEEDIKVSNLLIDLWTSFALTGTPESKLAPKWIPLGREGERHILNIDAKNPVMIRNLPDHDRS